jgi:hypothetical protein
MLKGIFLSLRMVLIPELQPFSKSDIRGIKSFNSGQVETINASSGVLSAICQISSSERHKWMQYF